MCQFMCSPVNIVLSWAAIVMYSFSLVQATHSNPVKQPNISDKTYRKPAEPPMDQKIIYELMWRIEKLEKKYMDSEWRIQQLESCDCTKSCKVNGTVVAHGSSWRDGCDIWKCQSGEVKSERIECPRLNCKNPEPVDGECCPVCKKPCLHHDKIYEHGEVFNYHCSQCTCSDGWTDCKHLDRTTCPPLNCTDGEFTLEDACCPICLGTDLCEHLGHPCHADASCKTIKSPDSQTFTCRCKEGFLGDGKQCSDYNECTTTDASKRHKCSANSQCINLPGTYRCDCLPGYVMSDDGYTCQDVDECAFDQDECHDNAICVNTDGGHDCVCLPGFYGDGYDCQPPDPTSSPLTESQLTDESRRLNVYNSGNTNRVVTSASSLLSLPLLLLLSVLSSSSSYIFYAL